MSQFIPLCVAGARDAVARRLGDQRRQSAQRGFTLIELLVVITILGVLSAIVVFAVGGVGDKGQDAACKTDKATIQTAEEAYYAEAGTYATMAQLAAGNAAAHVPGPLLQAASKWYDANPVAADPTATPPVVAGSDYTITPLTASPCS